MTKVKSYTAKTKTGKLKTVKQHDRKGKLKSLRNFYKKVNGDVIKEALKYKDKKININDYKKIEDGIKNRSEEFVSKLGTPKIGHLVFQKLQKDARKIFKNSELNIRFVKTKEKPVKTNYKFYFGSGNTIDHLISSKKSFRRGDSFYSQKIGDENWGDTLKRKNLIIMTINRIESDKVGNRTLSVEIMKPKNDGKKLGSVKKVFTAKEFYNILKRGKLNDTV